MTGMSRLVTGGVVAGVALVGVTGAAWAGGSFDTGHATAATAGTAVVANAVADTATTARPKAHHPARADRFGRAEHGQLTVRRHGADVTLLAQRGTVTAVSAPSTGTGSVTVRSVDGHTQVYAVTAASRVREHGSVEPLASVTVGERVRVVAQEAGTTADVLRLAVRPAAKAKAAAAGASDATGSAAAGSTGV